jgi:hypothetical protein
MGRTRDGLFGPSCFAVIALVVAGLHPVDNPDSFGHLAAGRQIAALGHVPSLDTFSYFRPASQPWVNYEWLSDVALFEVFRVAGFAGLNTGKLALIAAIAALMVWLAFARAGKLGARLCALVLILAVPALRYRLSVRPHLFGLLWSAIYWIGLLAILAPDDDTSMRRRRRWVIALGCAHVVWVNLHGSHLLGLALTIVACVASVWRPAARKPLATLLGLELAASCISPYGPKIVAGAIEHVFDPRYRLIVGEWQAWTPAQPLWFALGIVLQALLVALAWRGLPRDAAGLFMRLAALLTLLMAARSMRFVADFLVLSAPLVAEGFAQQYTRWRARRTGPSHASRSLQATSAWWLGLAAASGFACQLSIRLPPYAAFGLGADTRTLPAASTAWLARERPHARVFAAMEDGWFAMWGAPDARVLMDGRVPFYGPDFMIAMIRAWSSGPALQEVITSSRTDAVIVQPALAEHQAALASMSSAPDFRMVMIENKHALFVKAGPSDGPAALHALSPGYSSGWLLADRADLGAIDRELSRLRTEPNARAYVAWVDALRALRPLAREEGRAGFAPPRDAMERDAAERALERLRPLRAVLEDVPSVSAYHALAAVLACKLDEAERVLHEIRDEDASRESTFAAQELALRRAELDSVRAFLSAAGALPEAKGDVWLAALKRELDAPSLCPAAAHGGDG